MVSRRNSGIPRPGKTFIDLVQVQTEFQAIGSGPSSETCLSQSRARYREVAESVIVFLCRLFMKKLLSESSAVSSNVVGSRLVSYIS